MCGETSAASPIVRYSLGLLVGTTAIAVVLSLRLGRYEEGGRWYSGFLVRMGNLGISLVAHSWLLLLVAVIAVGLAPAVRIGRSTSSRGVGRQVFSAIRTLGRLLVSAARKAPWPSVTVVGLFAAFVALPSAAFVSSCDSRENTFTVGLTPSEWPGMTWSVTGAIRPGTFTRTTLACGLSPEGSVDADFDRSNHTLGLTETGRLFLSSNLWGLLEVDAIQDTIGSPGEPVRYRMDPAIEAIRVLARVVVVLSIGLPLHRKLFPPGPPGGN